MGQRPNSSDQGACDGVSMQFSYSIAVATHPKLTAERVQNQEDGSTDTRALLADVELRRNTTDGIAVEGGVEVHGDLDDEDDGEDVPLLLIGVGVAQLVVAVVLGDFILVVGAQLLHLGLLLWVAAGGWCRGIIFGVLLVERPAHVVGFHRLAGLYWLFHGFLRMGVVRHGCEVGWVLVRAVRWVYL